MDVKTQELVDWLRRPGVEEVSSPDGLGNLFNLNVVGVDFERKLTEAADLIEKLIKGE